MKYKNPVSMAVSSACLLFTGSAQADPDSVGALCGMTVDSLDSPHCDAYETLTEDCKINVAPGNNFSITHCYINADGYDLSISAGDGARVEFDGTEVSNVDFSIKGGLDASLRMDNSPIVDASGIEIKFKGGDPGLVNCLSQYVIDISDPDFVANGLEGEVSIKTDCGNINIYDNDPYYSHEITATDSVEVKAKMGEVYIAGDNMLRIASPVTYNTPGGSIHLSAGGEGDVRVYCSNLESGSIKVDSDGNGGYVGCY